MTLTEGLLAKYAEILALRRARSVAPPIARLRALAATFPGALRELDALGDDEVEKRLALLRVADGKSAPEAWMVGMHWFHVELGALLRAKRWLGARARSAEAGIFLRGDRRCDARPSRASRAQRAAGRRCGGALVGPRRLRAFRPS